MGEKPPPREGIAMGENSEVAQHLPSPEPPGSDRAAVSRLESSLMSYPVMVPALVNTVTQAVVSDPYTTAELPQHPLQTHLRGIGDQAPPASTTGGDGLVELVVRGGPRDETEIQDEKVLAGDSSKEPCCAC